MSAVSGEKDPSIGGHRKVSLIARGHTFCFTTENLKNIYINQHLIISVGRETISAGKNRKTLYISIC
jgi:hypothetical protein